MDLLGTKLMAVRIVTRLGEFTVYVPKHATGKEIFDRIIKALDLREFWYFGLTCLDKDAINTWVDFRRRITDQKIAKREPIAMRLTVKYYPGDMGNLIQRVTKMMFYLHLRDTIFSEIIYCPPDVALVLASYAAQEQYGDYTSSVHRQGLLLQSNLFPPGLLQLYKMTPFAFENILIQLYSRRSGLSREQAIDGYLQVVQDLHMYGVRQFPVTTARGTPAFIAVDSFGVKIYSQDNILVPVTAFHLAELRQVAFQNKRLTLTLGNHDTELLIFAPEMSIAKRVFLRCLGYRDLYERSIRDDVSICNHLAEGRAKEMLHPTSCPPRTVDMVADQLQTTSADVRLRLRQYNEGLKAAKLEVSRLEKERARLERAVTRKERVTVRNEQLEDLNVRMKSFCDFHTALSAPTVAPLAPTYCQLYGKSVALRSTSTRQVAEGEHLRSLLEETIGQERQLRKLMRSVFKTRHDLHLADGDVMENDDVRERVYKFTALVAMENQAPLVKRKTFSESDVNTKHEIERLVAELETMVIHARLSRLDEIQRDLYRSGRDKYSILQGFLSIGIPERIRKFETL